MSQDVFYFLSEGLSVHWCTWQCTSINQQWPRRMKVGEAIIVSSCHFAKESRERENEVERGDKINPKYIRFLLLILANWSDNRASHIKEVPLER